MAVNYLRFDSESPEMKVFTDWWDALNERRGDRAELRRCSSLTDVAILPAYHQLRIELGKYGKVNLDAVALLAGLAAHVKINSTENTLAEQMASGKSDESARVSGLRFRRLIKIKELEDLYRAMNRIVALLRGVVNLQSLAKSMYYWNDRTRKQWAFEYYTKSLSEQ